MTWNRVRSRYFAAIVLAVLTALGLMAASAAHLTVSAHGVFLQNLTRCTNATIPATGFKSGGGGGKWNRVRLVGVPDACAGLPISVVVYRASGQLASGTATANVGTVDISVSPKYTSGQVLGVALLIGGWGVPTTWTPGGTVVSLLSFQNGEYVTAASRTSPLIADSTSIGNSQEFDLTINDDASVSFRSHASSRYVTAGTTSLVANSTAIGTAQKFVFITNPDGTIALQALVNDMYVCAEDAGASPLIANRTWILEWEEFYLVIN